MQKATSVAMLAFVLSSMLAMGLGLTVSQIIAPLRNARLVVLSLLVNFVLMPLGAVALAALLRLDQPRAWVCFCWAWPPAHRSCQNWLRLHGAT